MSVGEGHDGLGNRQQGLRTAGGEVARGPPRKDKDEGRSGKGYITQGRIFHGDQRGALLLQLIGALMAAQGARGDWRGLGYVKPLIVRSFWPFELLRWPVKSKMMPSMAFLSKTGGSVRAIRVAAWMCAVLCACPSIAQQSLPPLPKAVSPADAKAKAGKLPEAPMAASIQDKPLFEAGPKDLPKAASPCEALPEKGAAWMMEAFGTLEAQTLRPNGSPKARDAFAEVWLFFKSSRAKGFDMDPYGNKIDAIYKALYPAGAFAPETPFERFKEPRRACKKPAVAP